VVNSPGRLKQFLFWITIFALVITLLAVLQYHGAITLNTLKAMEDRRGDGYLEEVVLTRLRGTGLFGDPNDFSSLLAVALVLSLYWIIDGHRNPMARYFWVPAFLLFGYALVLTQSRGGLLAALLGILVLLYYRLGPRATTVLVLCLVPIVLSVFVARQTTFAEDDTATGRFHHWADGLELLKAKPLLGVGMNQFDKHSYLVAHNSYLHCYGELGFLGGTLFFGAFFYALWVLWRLTSRRAVILDPTARQLNPYLLAAVVGYAAALVSLSRSYVVPTYLVFGLVTVHVLHAATHPPLALTRLDGRLVQRIGLASVAFLAVMYVTCRLMVRY
jgi:O-antigen ligase